MQRFQAKRGRFISILLFSVIILPLLAVLFDQPLLLEKPVVLLPLATPIILVIWVYFDTGYRIEEGRFYYRSAFLRGSVDIDSIHEIEVGKTKWSGMKKAAISQNGMTIRYRPFEEVYVAPTDNEQLIAALVKINPRIAVQRY
ncbi:MAG: PH domain-containing protein [Cyclobacteriaceae bacterium]|nr:PH domain-containing protein [Cyclobacteriaceae bacterium]MCH8515885.1 PH domain-containing protein [Cyclobacteriaceae bacterium]